MAKIPLRVYNREIENLINRGQIDQAIGHCRHILRFFPKHIDTYRLLGKAYLEGQHYAEASDVLQRVLSTVPDDFISQIGMSIIREDEGNLDAAIWHMERAFEVQAANTAVQGELRRLYGRRDGIEPPKVRLTRGALVRMYARGELYQQAIGEIRAALAEDPKRVDIEVILARMYFLSGLKVEATEVCSRLITKLPFCFEANRILAEILPETARAEDAKIYQQRVDAMDPYAAYLSINTPTLADVPDNVVTVERLEGDLADSASQKPEWARTVGIEWEEQQDVLPEWMQKAPDAIIGEMPIADEIDLPDLPPTQHTPITSPQTGNIPSTDQEEIPDWMQAAGWGKSDGEEQPPAENAFLDDESASEALAGGDIPEWLQAMAPQTPADETPSAEDQDRLNLLSSLLPGEKPFGDSAGQPEGQIPAPDAGLPDWLSAGEDTAGAPSTLPAGEETPDWLASFAATPGESQPDAGAAEEMPEWLRPADQESKPPASAQKQFDTAILPDDFYTQELVSPEPAAGPAPENADDAFTWLEALATRQGAAEETLLTKPEDRNETPPDWLKKIGETEPLGGPVLAETAGAPDSDVPDWLKEMQTGQAPEQTSAPVAFSQDAEMAPETVEAAAEEAAGIAQPFAGMSTDDVPEWLKETLPEAGQAQEEAPVEATSEIKPTFIEESAVPETEIQPAEQPAANAPAAQTPEMDSDSAFAWLESLAARQGADEETLLVKPEERLETPPDWVQQQIASGAESVPPRAAGTSPLEEELSSLEEAETDFTGDVLPDWMRSPEAEKAAAETEETIPDWLKESVAETAPEPAASTDVPDWLRSLESQADETLTPLIETPAGETAPSAGGDDLTRTEAMPTGQSAGEEKPREPAETLPEWITDQAAQPEVPESESVVPSESTVTPEPIAAPEAIPTPPAVSKPAAEATSSDVPDWLKELEENPEETIAAIEAVFEAPEAAPDHPEAEAVPAGEWMQELPESGAAEGETSTVAETPVEPARVLPVSQVPAPAVRKAAPIREVAIDAEPTLNRARISLKRGKVQEALIDYMVLIKQNWALDDTIQDLKDALYQHPVDIDLWQAIGDAYAHSNRLQDALDAYTKAEELLR